jgi:hypothetical protein
MTFKDLKRRISNSNQQQTQSFDKLQNKPFWIWNIEEHKLEDIRTKGECCFNHIIGLPTRCSETGEDKYGIDPVQYPCSVINYVPFSIII